MIFIATVFWMMVATTAGPTQIYASEPASYCERDGQVIDCQEAYEYRADQAELCAEADDACEEAN
jgi:hypothetical protein